MKLSRLGDQTGVSFDGIVLTPDEYDASPIGHPMLVVGRTSLFVLDGRYASCVSLRDGPSYRLDDATPQERERLWGAGYRMVGLEASCCK